MRQEKSQNQLGAYFHLRIELVGMTGEDVAFSIKVIKCPFTDNQHLKPTFDAIERVDINKENAKRFEVVFSEPTMMLESIFTDLYILPKHIYDADNLLETYSEE